MSDTAGGDMVEFTKTIKDPLGLHARPVALLYDIIAKHRSDCRSASATAIPMAVT